MTFTRPLQRYLLLLICSYLIEVGGLVNRAPTSIERVSFSTKPIKKHLLSGASRLRSFPSSCGITCYSAGIGTLHATSHVGCRASQGRFPPPLLMRAVIATANYLVVLVQNSVLCFH